MKPLLKPLASIFLVLSILSLWNCKQEQKETSPQEMPKPATVQELGQMNRDFVEALKAHDAVAAANLYDENASLLPPNEDIVTGRENIRAYWQGAIDAGIIDASVKTLDAKSDGDLGYEIGTFELRFLGPDNDTIVDTGKFTEILQRNQEGKWISLYGMWSNNAPVETE
ncbi:YybH family protein [Gaetbulibacter aestuarii]|uniref:DUF4440 domain-containing protein n=1 Tax=Gaetbulibacter aestuarii TaxID=1502358 RepID=A0ABW7MZI2_9FLAO